MDNKELEFYFVRTLLGFLDNLWKRAHLTCSTHHDDQLMIGSVHFSATAWTRTRVSTGGAARQTE